jgi:superfamily II DNA/RNA helicase
MARGIDIRNAVFVINAGSPKKSDRENDIDIDTYLHRVGRTGRYNDKGIALTLGVKEEVEKLINLVKKVHKISIERLPNIKQLV